jgi:branched-chain amino acid transport system ATP-binding protein
MTALLEIADLTAGYGRVDVLHGLTMSVGIHGNVGLFGPNGHGKTTLLRAISGLVRARAGTIRFGGQDIANRKPRDIVGLGIIHSSQGNRLFPDLTIGECLTLGAYTARARQQEEANRERALKIFPKLGERWNQKVRTLSGGERQMVSIGTALMSSPAMLILDEPTLGLAPKIKQELCQAVLDISAGGIPLLVVEQDVEFLLELSQHLYLINHGQVATEIKPGQSMDHADIMALYFGQ